MKHTELYKKVENDLEKEFNEHVIKPIISSDSFISERDCELKMLYNHYMFYKNKVDSIPLNSLENVMLWIICNDHIKAMFLYLNELDLLKEFLKKVV